MNESMLFLIFATLFGIVGIITVIATIALLKKAFWGYAPPTNILDPNKHLEIECFVGNGDDFITISGHPIDVEIISQQKFCVRFDNDINEWSALINPAPLGSKFDQYYLLHRELCTQLRLIKGHTLYVRLKNTSEEKVIVTQYLRTTTFLKEGVAGLVCLLLTAVMFVMAWQFYAFMI